MENNKIFSDCRFIETADIVKKHIKKSNKIIEIGANDASFKKFLNQADNKNWITVDKFGNPDIITDIDGRKACLPFEDKSIDLIICTEVLEHLCAGTSVIKEMSRVLQPDGLAIISVPNIVSLKSRIKVLCGQLPGNAASGDCGHPLGGTGYLVDGEWVGGHVVDFNFTRLRRYLERGRLRIVKHYRLSLQVSYNGRNLLSVSSKFLPAALADYILVEAQSI